MALAARVTEVGAARGMGQGALAGDNLTALFGARLPHKYRAEGAAPLSPAAAEGVALRVVVFMRALQRRHALRRRRRRRRVRRGSPLLASFSFCHVRS